MMKRLNARLGMLAASALCTTVACAQADDVQDDQPRTEVLAQQSETIDLSGTWGVTMTTASEMSAPLIGKSASTAALGMRFYVYKEGEQYRADIQICRLSTDSSSVKVNYVNVLPHMKASVAIPPFEAALGGDVPLPDVLFRIGQDQAGRPVDADQDGKPAVTVPVVALGILSMNAYTGFELNVSLEASLTDAQTIHGTYAFGALGKVFGSSSPLLPPGELRVTQTDPDATYTAKRFEGDVPCTELMRRL